MQRGDTFAPIKGNSIATAAATATADQEKKGIALIGPMDHTCHPIVFVILREKKVFLCWNHLRVSK